MVMHPMGSQAVKKSQIKSKKTEDVWLGGIETTMSCIQKIVQK